MTFTIIDAFGVATALVTIATILARATPTTKDDNAVEKARKFLEKLGNLFLTDNVKK